MPGLNKNILREIVEEELKKTSWNDKNGPWGIIQENFEESKKEMLEDFDKHKVTKSLRNGPEGSDGIVKTAKGGNLASFIGLSDSRQAVEDLRQLLQDQVQLKKQERRTRKLSGDRISFEVPIYSPTQEEIDKEMNSRHGLPWSDKSFVRLIEDGVPWFASYLYNAKGFDNSESGFGIEAKKKSGNNSQLIKVRDGDFPGISYISKILSNFRKKITGKD